MTAKKGLDGVQSLDRLLAEAEIDIVDFDYAQAAMASSAFERFGKGRHPARLNFGDCAAYALARTRGQPLLFKGSDFSLTDLKQVTPSQD